MNPFSWLHLAPDTFVLMLIFCLLVEFLLNDIDFIILPLVAIFKAAFNIDTDKTTHHIPSGLIIIPSLLRNQDDYDGFISSIESCTTNEYPNDLVIIASVDGCTENPEYYNRLVSWVANHSLPDNIKLYISSNDIRRGKIMAIEAGVRCMQELVDSGQHAAFPELYFSVDADTILGEHALERLAAKMFKTHWLTGNKRRAAAGKICSHPDAIWLGWKKYFTVKGQIYINAAREFVVYGTRRYNLKMIPWIALPGLLYCTWSEVLIQSPRYMGFLQTIKFMDWVKWMFGYPPPKFSQYTGDGLPEALCGSTDDTTIALIVSVASWKDGKLIYDFPRTPFHAMVRLFMAWFVERSNVYAPEARAYTFVPPTMKGLWLQRIRWNSCRVECSGRFFRSFCFNWETACPFISQLSIVVFDAMRTLVCYVIIPSMVMGHAPFLYFFICGFVYDMLSQTLRTLVALGLEKKRSNYWITLWGLPFYNIYTLIFGFGTTAVGVIKDIFWFGTNVKFVPERTLIKGRSQRIAIMFRVKRFFSLCIRSIRYGDVPFGSFWFSWYEKPEFNIQNGFFGWTSGKKNSQYNLK